jgi:hypothetical protein
VVAGLAVLLALAGFVAQLRTPFAVTGFDAVLPRVTDDLLEAVSVSRLQRIDRALRAYSLQKGALPKRLEELVDAALVDDAFLHDPWRRPYHYETRPGGYVLSAVDDNGKTVPSTVIERSLNPERP